MKLKHLGDILCESHDMITMRAGVLYGRQTPLARSGRVVWRTGRTTRVHYYAYVSADHVATVRERKG
jgi:hypothetical protein